MSDGGSVRLHFLILCFSCANHFPLAATLYCLSTQSCLYGFDHVCSLASLFLLLVFFLVNYPFMHPFILCPPPPPLAPSPLLRLLTCLCRCCARLSTREQPGGSSKDTTRMPWPAKQRECVLGWGHPKGVKQARPHTGRPPSRSPVTRRPGPCSGVPRHDSPPPLQLDIPGPKSRRCGGVPPPNRRSGGVPLDAPAQRRGPMPSSVWTRHKSSETETVRGLIGHALPRQRKGE